MAGKIIIEETENNAFSVVVDGDWAKVTEIVGLLSMAQDQVKAQSAMAAMQRQQSGIVKAAGNVPIIGKRGA